jgi:hypothetical protein
MMAHTLMLGLGIALVQEVWHFPRSWDSDAPCSFSLPWRMGENSIIQEGKQCNKYTKNYKKVTE